MDIGLEKKLTLIDVSLENAHTSLCDSSTLM